MHKDFWLERWQYGQIGFHAPEPNQFLIKHFDKLKLSEGARIFVPLCGKSIDMHWLLARGYKVVGVELAEQAVRELFEELRVQPGITHLSDHAEYRHDDITVFTGDIFHLTGEMIGTIDAVYDRASLVALPVEMRKQYTKQLLEITRAAPQLLLTFCYDQSQMQGPPFSIDESEVKDHYESIFNIAKLESYDLPGGFRGKVAASEDTYLLSGF